MGESIKADMRKFISCQEGQQLVHITLLLPVLLAFLGLIVDVGNVYVHHRLAQNAADAAASAASIALYHSGRSTAISTAYYYAAQSGYDNDGTTNNVRVDTPPINGAYAGNSHYIQVHIQDNVLPIFAAVVWNGTFRIRAYATAGYAMTGMKSPIIVLDKHGRGTLRMSGLTQLRVKTGNIHVNSNHPEAVQLTGISSIITADPMTIVGGYRINGWTFGGGGPMIEPPIYTGPPVHIEPEPIIGPPVHIGPKPIIDSPFHSDQKSGVDSPIFIGPPVHIGHKPIIGPPIFIKPEPITGAPVLPDPLAKLPSPKFGSYPVRHGTSSHPKTLRIRGFTRVTLNPGIYYGGIRISSMANVTFNPGIYIMAGYGLRVSGNSNIRGSGVSFYISQDPKHSHGDGRMGSIDISGNVRVQFTPPTGGAYAGILFFQDRKDQKKAKVTGSGALNGLKGIMYLPAGDLELSGTANSHINLVVNRLNIKGRSTLVIDGYQGAGWATVTFALTE